MKSIDVGYAIDILVAAYKASLEEDSDLVAQELQKGWYDCIATSNYNELNHTIDFQTVNDESFKRLPRDIKFHSTDSI